MKNLIFSIFLFLVLFHQALFSQNNYFGDVTDVSLNTPPLPYPGVTVYFELEQINTDFLDIVVPFIYGENRIGQWNLNNGNGTFGTFNTFDMQTSSGPLKGNAFVKLRTSSEVKDLVIGRTDGLEVHWNENGSISDVMQNFTTNSGVNWSFFESGVFDASDNCEDILVGTGTSILYYFVNNNDGYLQSPNSVTLPQQISNFKLCQLEEKSEGYALSDSDNRSDIIFIHKSQPTNKIYAYLNDNQNGFITDPHFAAFSTDKDVIDDLEVADLDGDGFNDVIVICRDNICPAYFYVRAYRNVQGLFIDDNTLFWSHTLNENYEISCGSVPKVTVADINKDGLNDLIFVINLPDDNNGLKVMVFINQNTTPLFTQSPQDYLDIAEIDQPDIKQAMTADIYGGQENDGGGIAVLLAYHVPLSGGIHTELHVKVVNAYESRKHSPPPPPIVQGFLEYNQQLDIWHPHLHLDYRGERDFDHFEIWKWKVGMLEPTLYASPVIDTGWTDYGECVLVEGGDLPDYNCFYYAKSVDYQNTHVSIPSQYAYYTVGCIPVCDGCGDDNPIPNQNHYSIKPPEKFSTSSYPNPFNPITKINYTLPYASKVTIRVFDVMGRMLKELVNDYKSAGYYTVIFDGSNLASGIYFYRIETVKFTSVNKIVLIK